MAAELNLDDEAVGSDVFLRYFSGNIDALAGGGGVDGGGSGSSGYWSRPLCDVSFRHCRSLL
jgi:hypothetical protein